MRLIQVSPQTYTFEEPWLPQPRKRTGTLSPPNTPCEPSSGGNLDNLTDSDRRRPPRTPNPPLPAAGDKIRAHWTPGDPGPARPRPVWRCVGAARRDILDLLIAPCDERLRAGLELGLRGPSREGPPRTGGRLGGRRGLPPHLIAGLPGPRAPSWPLPRASASRSALFAEPSAPDGVYVPRREAAVLAPRDAIATRHGGGRPPLPGPEHLPGGARRGQSPPLPAPSPPPRIPARGRAAGRDRRSKKNLVAGLQRGRDPRVTRA